MWSAQSRPDRLAGLYPLLFAAGGVWLGELAARRRSVRIALPIWIAAWGLLLLPVGTPLLSPDQTAQHLARLGISHQSERGAGKRTALPQYSPTGSDGRCWLTTSRPCATRCRPGTAGRVAFFAQSYGQASALDWLGSRGVWRRCINPQHVVLLGTPSDNPEVAIVLGDDRESLDELFGEVTQSRVHECGACMPWRNHMPIWIVRKPKVRLADKWPGWKKFE